MVFNTFNTRELEVLKVHIMQQTLADIIYVFKNRVFNFVT